MYFHLLLQRFCFGNSEMGTIKAKKACGQVPGHGHLRPLGQLNREGKVTKYFRAVKKTESDHKRSDTLDGE